MNLGSEDYLDLELPPCIQWSAAEVASWIENLGFPQYKECFESNFITGRKLILIEASHLPKMGVTDFEDIKSITAAIRKLLNTRYIGYFRNLSMTPREPWALFLEKHSRTGEKVANLKYSNFLKNTGLKHNEG
ncbi:sterile alpha motif domain-containing protein 15-like [Parasteatoda tepidariorum]|uniref:sterile alpha motif domain-containing protein 15-like n=1 Tax=Parasteatoda tepidariorum TaxID=114398 RepID=UPI0039BD77F7